MTTKIRIRWHGDMLNAKLASQVQKVVNDAAGMVVKECREVVGEPYPPASAPGQPPRLRTGVGQRSIGFVPGKGDWTARIALAKAGGYMLLFLELGTRFIAPRPWFRPTFDRMMPTVNTYINSTLARIFK